MRKAAGEADLITLSPGDPAGVQAFSPLPLRTDVDDSFLERGTVPRVGVKYFDDTEWNWTVTGRREAREKVQQLLREHGKK